MDALQRYGRRLLLVLAALSVVLVSTMTPALASGEWPEVGRLVPAPTGQVAANWTGVEVTCIEAGGNRVPGAFGNPVGAAPCSTTIVSPTLLLQPGNLTCHVTLQVKIWRTGETQVQGVTVVRSVTNDARCDTVIINNIPGGTAWANQLCEDVTTTPHRYVDGMRLSFTLPDPPNPPTTVTGYIYPQVVNPAAATGFIVNSPVQGAPPFTLSDAAGATITPNPPTFAVVSTATPCKWQF